jgi:hypothetical protein
MRDFAVSKTGQKAVISRQIRSLSKRAGFRHNLPRENAGQWRAGDVNPLIERFGFRVQSRY